jgi:CSLREA domain-containing protein
VAATAAAAIALCVAPPAVGAATITPDDAGDDFTDNNVCSLREAIELANDNASTDESSCAVTNLPFGNDTIVLAQGTFTLTIDGSDDTNQTGDLDADTSTGSGDLIIDGAGAGTTTIDATGLTAPTDRVLQQAASTGTLTVGDLTVTKGNAGAVANGGGVLSGTGTSSLVLDGVRVHDNKADGQGGGVAAEGASLSITDSTVSMNTNTDSNAAGVYSQATTATVDSSVIEDNTLTHDGSPQGAGMVVTGTVTITDSVIAGNDAIQDDTLGTSEAGGLAVLGAAVTLERSEVSGNTVTGGQFQSAGGIRVASGSLDLVNSTVSGNQASEAGGAAGGLQVVGGTVDVIHTTFGPNQAANPPTAIDAAGGTTNLRGSVVETDGTQDACDGTITSQGRNVLTDGTCGGTGTGDEQNADPMLGPLQDNGGPDAGAPGFTQPVLSHAPAAASTAVEHVPVADCDDQSGLTTLTVDQRGEPRPADYDRNAVDACDAGSLELQPPPGTCAGKTATITGTSAGEVIEGTSARDIVAALGGNDTISGFRGDDVICGGDGNDDLDGGKGADKLYGEDGKDVVDGRDKNDTHNGGAGKKDLCRGGAGKKDKAKKCETKKKIP